jgi:hypothetical protein
VDLWSPNLNFRFHSLVSGVGPWFAWLSSPLAVFVFLPGAARLCLCGTRPWLRFPTHKVRALACFAARACWFRCQDFDLLLWSSFRTQVLSGRRFCVRAQASSPLPKIRFPVDLRAYSSVFWPQALSLQILVTGPSLGLRSASCLHGFLGAGQIMVHAPQGFLSGRFFLFCILVTGDLSAHLIFFSRFFFRTGVCFTDFRAPNPCSGQAIFLFLFVLLLPITCFILCCVRSVGTV